MCDTLSRDGYFFRNNRGFTLIETLVVVAILGVLAGLAVANFRTFKTRAYNATALTDFRNIKTALLAGSSDPEDTTSFIIFNQTGPGVLPGRMSHVALSEGVRTTYVIDFSIALPTTQVSWKLVELAHLRGSIRYRFWDVNGTRIEQEIAI